jgi:hypothetical protein
MNVAKKSNGTNVDKNHCDHVVQKVGRVDPLEFGYHMLHKIVDEA